MKHTKCINRKKLTKLTRKLDLKVTVKNLEII